MKKRVALFVCTGNICRSPMAEYMLRDMLGEDSEWVVRSAGVSAGNGSEATPQAVETMRRDGIDLSAHRSRPVDRSLLEEAELILVMTAGHRDQLLSRFPDIREKLFLLKSFAAAGQGGDIGDPIGLPLAGYGETHDELMSAMPDLVLFMRNLRATSNRGDG
ncbi:MAG: low molecular weight protein arginine phosphatase [Lentisphaerae bacterium]|nr:low molecular weight protein arginine phosphatase [Lentisphaerota bacterium]